MRLRWHLVVLVLAAAVPLLVFTGLVAHQHLHDQREILDRGLLDTGRPVVSDLFVALGSGRPVVSVGVPVVRDGRVVYALEMAIEPEVFTRLLRGTDS